MKWLIGYVSDRASTDPYFHRRNIDKTIQHSNKNVIDVILISSCIFVDGLTYISMQFKEITGHHEIKLRLLDTVENNRVSHAQIFLGPEGNGGLALAIAYAQYINCTDRQDQDSCGQCASCRKYNKYIHPDLHFSYPFFAKHKDDTAVTFINTWRTALQKNPYLSLDDWRASCDVDNKQANINIAEAHDIIKKLSLKTYEAPYKVLIMWLPEYLDKQGNALLKLIEEPPEKTIFLLVAENTDKILNTILSRTQLLKINAYGSDAIKTYLKQNFELSEQRIEEIALISDGNISRARHLAEEKEEPYFDTMVQWLRYCATDSGKALIEFCDKELAGLGRENQKSFLLYTIQIMRTVLMNKEGLGRLTPLPAGQETFAQKFGERYSVEHIEAVTEMLDESFYHIERNANAKLLFLDLSLRLILLFKYNTFRRKADSII